MIALLRGSLPRHPANFSPAQVFVLASPFPVRIFIPASRHLSCPSWRRFACLLHRPCNHHDAVRPIPVITAHADTFRSMDDHAAVIHSCPEPPARPAIRHIIKRHMVNVLIPPIILIALIENNITRKQLIQPECFFGTYPARRGKQSQK